LKQFRIQALISCALLLGAATLRADTHVPARPPAQNAPTSHPASEVITDEVGRRVEVPAEVKRIVTLAPDLTETVYAMGLGDRLAGDTNFCDNPPAAKSKPHVGDPQNPSLEAIAGLRPDLVLASASINREETVDAIERLGIAVYTSDPHTVRGMLDSVGRMGEVMGAGAQGREVVAQLRERLDAVHAKLADRPMTHVLFVVWQQPLISIGQNTFIADALRWAGAESIISSDRNWPQVSLEEVVRLQPDYLIFTDDHGTSASEAQQLADLRSRPIWKDLRAVQLGHVVDMDEEIIRPSPGLVAAIERLAQRLYPEAFAVATENRKSRSEISAALLPLCFPGIGMKSASAAASQEASPCAR
jgi:iron complex transport system substrate-binding protein